MDTQRIRAILLAAEHGSLSRAAEEFSYTPSAMSHMADAIEAELGVTLLCRTPGGVRLSDGGRQLYERLRAVIQAEDELRAAASELADEAGGELNIGTYSSISQYILPELLHGFKEKHPRFKVNITVGDALGGWLSGGRADVIFSDEAGAGEGDEWVPILTDRYSAVLPAGILDGRQTVEREELYPYAYVSTTESSLKRYFNEESFSEVMRFVSVDDASVISMVREGLGVAVLPSLVLGNLPRGVRAVRLEPPISRTLGFAYRKKAVKKAAAARFIEYLKNYRL